LICNFFSSPGGTSERIFLYFATISASDRTGKGGGIGDEDIRVVHVHAHELFAQLAKGEIDDPKLAIAGYWLQEHLRQIGALDPSTVQYQVKNKPGLIVGYKTGAIDHVRGVSIWVNSENTDMMMDRFIGRTISARIRYLGANKEEDSVVEDTIQESLRGVIGERAHVKIGTVLVTESGMLSGSHQVQRVFHVATVEGGPGGGVKADGNKLIECVERVLTRVDQENNKLWRNVLGKKLDTILFPLLGAGDGGLSVESVAQKLIPVAVNYFRSTPHPTLKEIYFLAFRSRDKSACAKVLDGFCEQGALQRIEGTK
jgi:O-acetyl-ADP-ribose deacetylase (regulator of RNase III)